eukprot:scaffold13928_cov29-Tisochrysis_lutea.AAC.5
MGLLGRRLGRSHFCATLPKHQRQAAGSSAFPFVAPRSRSVAMRAACSCTTAMRGFLEESRATVCAWTCRENALGRSSQQRVNVEVEAEEASQAPPSTMVSIAARDCRY